jgi:hypothetical protein
MGVSRLRALPALLVLALPGLALAGCGSGGGSGSLSLSQLPLIPGARIVTRTRLCDSGSHAFCAIQAVIIDPHAHSSGGLVEREHEHLHSLGWTTSAGDDGDEVAADSPGHKVRVTYATALDDLIGLDEKWITRPWPIWAGLDNAYLSQTPAMSILLEAGPT